jgi:hypothetical protein
MSTADNPFGLSRFEHALWVQAGRPLGEGYRSWAALLGGIKDNAANTARTRVARMGAAGKAEEQASQEAFWRWELDQIEADARVTTMLLKTEAAVEADRQAERDAWQAKQARMNQLGELGP